MALPAPLKTVEVRGPIARSPLTPAILWPTAAGHGDANGSDATVFPSLTAIKTRLGAAPPRPLEAFTEAAWSARSRILVIDDYLFKPINESQQTRIDSILDWLPNDTAVTDVRFLTGSHPQMNDIIKQFQHHEAAVNAEREARLTRVQIGIRFTMRTTFPYLHDRFAVIDDELWHFGATVGGLHNQVNAATRGWHAETHDAIRFFEGAWNGDADSSGRGHRG